MKRLVLGITLWLLCLSSITSAGQNISSVPSLLKLYSAPDKGDIYALDIAGVSSLKGYSLILKYQGDIDSVRYETGNFLFEPLCVPLIIDKKQKTIIIGVTATKKVVTRTKEGRLGALYFSGRAKPTSIGLVQLLLADENCTIDSTMSQTKDANEAFLAQDEPADMIVKETRLNQSYPNPANPSTTIEFSIKEAGHVLLCIYNSNGQLVRRLLDKTLERGKYAMAWDGTNSRGELECSGVYFCRFTANGYVKSTKIVLIR